MMKNSKNLFLFIKTLSKSEKRHFKLTVNTYSKHQKNITALFNALDKMKKYDHELLVQKMKGLVLEKNIPALKINLMNTLLRSLRDLGTPRNAEQELRTKTDDILILYDRGQFELAKKRIVKAKIIANNLNNFSELNQLNRIEWRIAIKEGDTNALNQYLTLSKSLYQEQRRLNDVAQNLRQAVAHMNLLRTKDSTTSGKLIPKESLNSLVDRSVLHIDIEEYPVQCKIDYHAVWGYIHFIRQNKTLAYLHLKKAVVLFEELPSEFHFWSINVHHLLTSLAAFEMYDEYTKELNYVLAVAEKIPEKRKHSYFEREFNLKLLVAKTDRDLVEGNFDSLAKHIIKVHEYYEKYGNTLNNMQKMVFYYNFSYTYLGLKDYKKALFWVNELLNNSKHKNIRRDVKCYGEILNICIHYALGHHDVILSLANLAKRKFEKEQISNILLDKFFKLVKKEFIKPYDINVHLKCEEFISECQIKEYEGDLKSLSYYFNIPRWLNALIAEKFNKNSII